MKSTDPIKNKEKVQAIIGKTGVKISCLFGELKKDFQSGKIDGAISRVYVPRTKKSYFVTMRPTLGCVFREIKNQEE